MAPDISNNPQIDQGSAEIYFAKKLANNEKKVRDRALKKLQIWLKSKGASEKGIMKVFFHNFKAIKKANIAQAMDFRVIEGCFSGGCAKCAKK